jgi:hypothetical protein
VFTLPLRSGMSLLGSNTFEESPSAFAIVTVDASAGLDPWGVYGMGRVQEVKVSVSH